jgi:4-hydroxy-2-oxoglutarate aldolase
MRLSGVFAPIPTPFDESDRVDLVRLRKAIARWMTGPLTGLVVLGSNGEAVLIDDDEADRVITTAREAIPTDRPFIVGTGRESTQATVRATKRAADHGADAVLVRTPGFFKGQMTTDVFVRHYTTVADASPVPVLLYNFTALTGVNLPVAAVSRLATHPNIIGLKESGGDIATVSELVSSTPTDFNVLAGSAATFYAALCVGAVGGVLALSAVLPEPCKRLFELTGAGCHDEALAMHRQLMPMARLLGSAYGVPGLKAALNLLGYDVGVPRPPLTPLPEVGVAALREALAQFEVIPA